MTNQEDPIKFSYKYEFFGMTLVYIFQTLLSQKS